MKMYRVESKWNGRRYVPTMVQIGVTKEGEDMVTINHDGLHYSEGERYPIGYVHETKAKALKAYEKDCMVTINNYLNNIKSIKDDLVMLGKSTDMEFN